MALNTSSGFSKLANVEADIRSVLATIVEETEPKHRPYVSKKKEAKRRLAEQQAQLALLQTSTLDQIDFSLSDLTPAAKEHSDLDAFAAQLRRDWGLETTTEPAPVTAKKTPLKTKPPLEAAEAAFIRPKAKHHATLIKRQIEVILDVQRADGTRIPFYHCDHGINRLEAEIAAGKKARSFGLKVLGLIAISSKEYAREI
jgi:hypothetical protein